MNYMAADLGLYFSGRHPGNKINMEMETDSPRFRYERTGCFRAGTDSH